jgi:hypothetical protein
VTIQANVTYWKVSLQVWRRVAAQEPAAEFEVHWAVTVTSVFQYTVLTLDICILEITCWRDVTITNTLFPLYYHLSHWKRVLFEKVIMTQLVGDFATFTEIENSLQC